MNLYINGTGILSAAGSNDNIDFLNETPSYNVDRLLCKEPDYSAYIPAMQLRRMSKAVRMGIGAARLCMQNSPKEKTDAISVGTAFGCLQDTEVFLKKMLEQDEQMLTPTSFIQSTHNTVAGQIALNTKCNGHNLTFVHRGHSFEHAIINAQLYLNDHPEENILVGGIEELTETSIEVLKETQVYRTEKSTRESILNEVKKGSVAGEGATFFLISDRPLENNNICIKDICTFITKNEEKAIDRLNVFLGKNNIGENDIDLVVLGENGDEASNSFYHELKTEKFKDNSQAAFKHLCGEFPVSSSFALGLITHSVANSLPQSAVLNHHPGKIKRILLINNFLHHYSYWYLEVEAE